jgi:transposase
MPATDQIAYLLAQQLREIYRVAAEHGLALFKA